MKEKKTLRYIVRFLFSMYKVYLNTRLDLMRGSCVDFVHGFVFMEGYSEFFLYTD